MSGFYSSFEGFPKGISRIGLGTVKFGRNLLVKNACGDNFALPSDDTINQLLDSCIELGVNLLDTAPAYGVAEERLGKLLGNRRDKFFISTKTGEEFDSDSGTSTYNFTREYTLRSVERSLKRLNTDRLECVLVHCHRDDLKIIEDTPVLESLAELKQKGDILSFGVSTMSIEGGLKAALLCDVVMVSFNVDYQKELVVIKRAAELGKKVIIKKGFCSGNISQIDGVVTCLRAIYEHPDIASVTVGTINTAHLESNIKSAKQILGVH